MADQQRILGIAGSLRRDSYNRALLRAATELVPAGMTIEIYERLGDIPPYNEDVRLVGRPASVVDITEAVRAADGILIATPEYNYSIPGVLKNAIDWVSRPPQTSPLKNKPAAIMSASTGISGGMRAQLHLRQSFVFTDTPAMLRPEVIIPKAAERFDQSGRLTDEPTRQFVAGFLDAFMAWVRRFSAPVVLVLIAITLGACSKPQTGSAPITAPTPVVTKPTAPPPPPPTFVKTTSETRTTRLIDVRDGMTKQQLFRTVSDWLAQKYSIDVSDPRAGFLMTPWQASYLRDGLPDLHYRTRVVIRFYGDTTWKQVSARAEANWQQGDEWDIGYDQQLLEDVVVELRTRIGKRM